MERILVVDESAATRDAIRQIVEPEGFRVAGQACDGDEALSELRAERPDLVVLDLSAPGSAGLEVLRALRSAEADLPVVVCVGLGQETLAAEAVLGGANDFVVTPFHPFRLLATLWKVRRKRLVPARPS